MLRNLIGRFLRAIDNENTELYQWMLYVVMGSGSLLYFLVSNDPPVSMQTVVSHHMYLLWCLMTIGGPYTCLLGKVLRRTRMIYAGMWFQLAGDFITSTALFAFIAAAFTTWGSSAWGAIPCTILCIATALLTLRDIRRIMQVEKLNRS